MDRPPGNEPGQDRAFGQQPLQYGCQRQVVLGAADLGEVQVASANAAPYLWRLSVVGDLVVKITYGTGPRLQLVLNAPCEACIPGALTVTVRRRPALVGGTVRGLVTLARADGPGRNWARSLVDASVAAVNLPDSAGKVTALAASVVTVQGTAVALAIADMIPLVSGSQLTSGIAIVEHVI